MIFQAAQDLSRTTGGMPETPLVEVVITHVCRQWRYVAISFPHLWTSFRYTLLPQIRWQRIPHDRLTAYLERSRSLLVDLSFDLRSDDPNPDVPEEEISEHSPKYWPLLESAILHANRWRRISIRSDGYIPLLRLGWLEPLTGLEAPYLESFIFCPGELSDSFNEDYDEDGMVQSLKPCIGILKGGTPRLSYAWIDSSSPLRCLPPLSNVTVLRIEDYEAVREYWFSWKGLLDVIESLPLTGLSICGRHIEDSISFEEKFDGKLIMMHHLQHLCIGVDENFAVQILLHLSAPLLSTLLLKELELCIYTDPLRTFPALHHLTLIGVPLHHPERSKWIATMTPNVTHVAVFNTYHLNPPALLTHPLFRTTYWPKLSELTYDTPELNQFLIDVIASRSYYNVPLHSLRLKSSLVEKGGAFIKQLEQYCGVIESIKKFFNPEAPWQGFWDG